MLLLLFADLCFSLVLMLRLSCCWIFRPVALPIARDESVNLPMWDVRNLRSANCWSPRLITSRGARIGGWLRHLPVGPANLSHIP